MKKWSKEEKELLRQHYPNSTPAQLKEIFPDRTDGAIQSRAFIMGVNKTAEYIKTAPNAGRFQKGIVPYSKGKKGQSICQLKQLRNVSKLNLRKEVSHIQPSL